MNPNDKKKRNNIPFDLKAWLERESKRDRIMPDDYFPNVDDDPFFKRKYEQAMERMAKYSCKTPDTGASVKRP